MLQDTETDVKAHEEEMRLLRQTAASYKAELATGQSFFLLNSFRWVFQ